VLDPIPCEWVSECVLWEKEICESVVKLIAFTHCLTRRAVDIVKYCEWLTNVECGASRCVGLDTVSACQTLFVLLTCKTYRRSYICLIVIILCIVLEHFSWYKQNFRLLDWFKSNCRQFCVVVLWSFFTSRSIYRLSWFKSSCNQTYNPKFQIWAKLSFIILLRWTIQPQCFVLSVLCWVFCANKMRWSWVFLFCFIASR
jgi:hypothetical protein